MIEEIKRSELIDRTIYPKVSIKINDGFIYIGGEVEVDCGYIGYVRKNYPFDYSINTIEEIILDYKNEIERFKKDFKFINNEDFYQIKIIED